MDDFLQNPFTFPDVTGRRVLVAGLFPPGGVVAYGNTKERFEDDLEAAGPGIFRFPAGMDRPTSLAGRTHGTTAIDRALPPGPEGCPFVFVLKRDEEGLARAVAGLGFDPLVGVDTGGDSLAVTASSGPDGRDQRMLRVLRRTGLPVLHVVAAPGSDGEAPFEDLRQAL